jgi:hypothetical protein
LNAESIGLELKFAVRSRCSMRRMIAACRRAAWCNRTQIIASLAASLIGASYAFGANLALQVSSETAPAGGWAQIKIYAAAPTLISTGRIAINFDPSVFGPIARVAVFSAAGDSSGIAVVNAVVPQTIVPGTAVPIVVSVGGSPSQSGVTIAVQ